MKRRNILILAFGCSILVACAPVPNVNAIPPTVPQSAQRINAQLGEVLVAIAPVDEQQGYMPPGIATVTPVWRDGILDALKRSDMFQKGATRRVNIETSIIKLETVQNSDLSATTTVIALYRVIDAASSEVLWLRGISTSATVSYQEATVLPNRERLSLNAAIQNNIVEFIELYGNK